MRCQDLGIGALGASGEALISPITGYVT